MILPNSLGAPHWLIPVCIAVGLFSILVVWLYVRSAIPTGWKIFLAGLKILAAAILGLCLLEPRSEFEQVDPGSNILVVMADNSQSLQLKDRNSDRTRLENLKSSLNSGTWLTNLEDQFDVRKFRFDRKLQPLGDFSQLDANGQSSSLMANLNLLAERYRGRPIAGVLLFSDGNVTDWDPNFDFEGLPPVYTVTAGRDAPSSDIGLTSITASQTNFESAPVTITADAVTHGFKGKTVVARLLSNSGAELQRQEIKKVKDETPFAVRFQLKPEERGVNFLKVELSTDSEADTKTEATLLNNSRNVIVDRGRGPFRILYVTGRPNWEYKFMRRALADDHEVNLVGLIRLAKKEPKFSFRGRANESTNPLYRGFGNEEDQTAEQYDEPVIIRLDNEEGELRDGFPKDEATIFKYDAIVIDDLEAEFFTQDQKSLLQQFASRRGGGVLMLGGQESFGQGAYDRTAIGEMLPVYLDRDGPSQLNEQYRLQLTRDGWVQPWVRVNSTESAEKRRIEEMPGFQTINASRSIKPGATVLATVKTQQDEVLPALVVQRYGQGKTAAIMVGDLWRWQLATEPGNDDLKKSWRQTMRWLVSEVPRRVEVRVEPRDESGQSVNLVINVNDETYRAYDNAEIALTVTTPEGKNITLTPESSSELAGQYTASFVAQKDGPYTVSAEVKDRDGSPIETRETGWVVEPNSVEFESLTPNQNVMETIAERTGGEVIELNQLDGLNSKLSKKQAPNMITRTEPWWHQWPVFFLAIGLLVVEWGIRRWKGLA
jgi:uncharacterized membrane protein